MKIGIFGGTFNPIHSGHAMVINYLSQHAGLDNLRVMVAKQNPLKDICREATEYDRIEMVKLVANRFYNVIVDDYEIKNEGVSFTIDTLRYFSRLFPQAQISLIIGSDNWKTFDRWKDYEQILTDYEIIIYPRPGYELKDDIPGNVRILEECPLSGISSTFIRKEANNGSNLDFLVPVSVAEYIEKNQLYK